MNFVNNDYDESSELTENSDSCNENTDFGEKIYNSKFIYLPVKFKSIQVAALVDSGSCIDIMSDFLYNSLPQSC